MTHEKAIPLLSDLLAGAVSEPTAGEAWAHVGACEECRNVLSTMHRVRSAVAVEGSGVFSTHPSSLDIVQWAQGGEDLPLATLAEIGDHVRRCESCRHEAELTRRADAATRTEQRWNPGAWFQPSRWNWPRLALAPALAALALLAFPAYRGVVRLPALERENAATARDLAAARSELAVVSRSTTVEPWTGSARLLYLAAAQRGGTATPSVPIDPDQPYQPIVVDHRPFPGSSPSGTIEISIEPRGASAPIWHESVPAAQVWDAQNSALVVLAPATDLQTGEYRFRVRRDGVTTFEAPFGVVRKNP